MTGSRSARILALLVLIAGCHLSKPIKVEPKDVPGKYVFEGHESRDELVLNADGSFTRTAVYRGIRQTQKGRWQFLDVASVPYSSVVFNDESPDCLRSTRERGAVFGWTEPDQAICGGAWAPYFCLDRGRPAICFSEDEGFNFRKL